ncbi:MAG: hypothetical protein SFX18_17335 [Pirellulales bacterium]|nr:hypothetical protein [Pirellulales bacterium]
MFHRQIYRGALRLLLTAFLALGLATAALACPNCKDGLQSQDPQENNYARGFGYSVMFMLSMPALILTGWGVAIYRMVQAEKANSTMNLHENAIVEDK